MKHLLINIAIIIATSILAIAPAQGKDKGKTPRIEFKTQTHDFGNISNKGSVKAEFRFTNTGDGNLVITQANSECGCTKPEYPENPIAPKKEGTITVTYTPNGHIGHFEKAVTVRTNGVPKKIKLKIKGEVAK